MDAFSLLDIEVANSGEMKPTVSNPAAKKYKRLPKNPRMGRYFCTIFLIIKRIQVGRTVMLFGKSKYNVYAKITRRIEIYIQDKDLNWSIKKN